MKSYIYMHVCTKKLDVQQGFLTAFVWTDVLTYIFQLSSLCIDPPVSNFSQGKAGQLKAKFISKPFCGSATMQRKIGCERVSLLIFLSRLDDQVRDHIQRYFDDARRYLGDTDENVIELAMLFVQCLEVR